MKNQQTNGEGEGGQLNDIRELESQAEGKAWEYYKEATAQIQRNTERFLKKALQNVMKAVEDADSKKEQERRVDFALNEVWRTAKRYKEKEQKVEQFDLSLKAPAIKQPELKEEKGGNQ